MQALPIVKYWLNEYPTDSTFVLQPEGEPPREYFIEGKGWNHLDSVWDVSAQSFIVNNNTLYLMWWEMDDPIEWGWEVI